jgi:hypothetical protein
LTLLDLLDLFGQRLQLRPEIIDFVRNNRPSGDNR